MTVSVFDLNLRLLFHLKMSHTHMHIDEFSIFSKRYVFAWSYLGDSGPTTSQHDITSGTNRLHKSSTTICLMNQLHLMESAASFGHRPR